MLKVVNVKDDLESMKKIESLFREVFVNRSIIENINNNPFTNYFILYKNNELIGFINFDIIYDRCELININVINEEKGNGYGKFLMDYMINYIIKNNIVNITLEVRVDNLIAIKMYEKYGFIKKAIRKNYYQGVDGILMEKEIEEMM